MPQWGLLRTKEMSLICEAVCAHWVQTLISALTESSAKSTALPSSFTQAPGPVPGQEEPQSHWAPRAALTGALVCSALFCVQTRLPASVSVDLWLISFEKGDRNVHEGLALIFIFRQIFTTLNNYQEKEASAVNKLWTINSTTIKIQTERSGDCKGSVKWNAQGFLNSASVLPECVPSIHPAACRYHLPPSVKILSVTCCTSLFDFQDCTYSGQKY